MVAEGRSRIVPGFLATHAAGLAPVEISIAIGGILMGVLVGVAMGFAVRVAPGASALMGLPMRISPSGVTTGVTFKVVVVAGCVPGVTVHCESPV
ncbi:hypothetical protein D3C85_1149420 [compost metagenome]